jgi:soluble lytic murein transglycosylase-like protein
MKYFLIILMIFSATANANNFIIDPVYFQIRKNKPTLDHFYIMEISRVVHKMNDKYNIPVDIFTAILMQESKYNLEAVRCIKDCEFVYKKRGGTDFGIAQINHKTVKRYKFNLNKLTTDLEYSVEAGAVVLSDFKKKYGKDKEWYLRYNCGVGATDREVCQSYKKMVKKYL